MTQRVFEVTDAPPYERQVVPHPVTDYRPQCWRCRRTLAGHLSRPWELRCPKCKATNCSLPGAGKAV